MLILRDVLRPCQVILMNRYILFEVPANLVLRRVPPSWWFSFIMGGWGVVYPFLESM